MTDGTSQGLFIVVAIVIFGIFTVLAYILFEDTLSPALASMFTDATEQASQRLTDKTIVNGSDFMIYNDKGSLSNVVKTANGLSYESNGTSYTDGLYFPATVLEPYTKYELTYDITDLDGTVLTFGGHIRNVSSENFYVDGVDKGSYFAAINLPFNKGETKNIRVVFTSGSLVGTQDKEYTNGIAIHPNRHHTTLVLGGNDNGRPQDVIVPAFKVKIENIHLKKVE